MRFTMEKPLKICHHVPDIRIVLIVGIRFTHLSTSEFFLIKGGIKWKKRVFDLFQDAYRFVFS
jgi:hypothetical protein